MIQKILKNTFDGMVCIESFFHKKNASFIKNGKKTKRVLIMRKDELGDCTLFYSTLHAYREYYTDAEIVLVFPQHFKSLSPILSKDLVDEVIWFDRPRFESDLSYRRRFMLNLARMNFDIFIYPVFVRETVGHFMMKAIGASETIGVDGEISEHGRKAEKRGTLKFTRLIRPPENMISEIERDAYFAEKITRKPVKIVFPTIDVKKLPSKRVKELMHTYKVEGNKYAVIFPGAGIHYRIWMAENFAYIIDHIVQKGLMAIVCGGPKETTLAEKIIALTKAPEGKVINLAGKTDLSDMAHILSDAQFYLGSDTGILHLAAAVGCPIIGIVGSGGLKRFFPYGDPTKNRAVYDKKGTYKYGDWSDARPLMSQPDTIHPSIRNITVADVEKEVDYMMSI